MADDLLKDESWEEHKENSDDDSDEEGDDSNPDSDKDDQEDQDDPESADSEDEDDSEDSDDDSDKEEDDEDEEDSEEDDDSEKGDGGSKKKKKNQQPDKKPGKIKVKPRGSDFDQIIDRQKKQTIRNLKNLRENGKVKLEKPEGIEDEDWNTMVGFMDQAMPAYLAAMGLDKLPDALRDQNNNQELDKYLSRNPHFKDGKFASGEYKGHNYKDVIQKYSEHPDYAGMPPNRLVATALGEEMLVLGAKIQKNSSKKAKDSRSSGSSSGGKTGKNSKRSDTWKNNKADVEATAAEIEQGVY